MNKRHYAKDLDQERNKQTEAVVNLSINLWSDPKDSKLKPFRSHFLICRIRPRYKELQLRHRSRLTKDSEQSRKAMDRASPKHNLQCSRATCLSLTTKKRIKSSNQRNSTEKESLAHLEITFRTFEWMSPVLRNIAPSEYNSETTQHQIWLSHESIKCLANSKISQLIISTLLRKSHLQPLIMATNRLITKIICRMIARQTAIAKVLEPRAWWAIDQHAESMTEQEKNLVHMPCAIEVAEMSRPVLTVAAAGRHIL